MSITNGYRNFGASPIDPPLTGGIEEKVTTSAAPSTPSEASFNLEATFNLLGIANFAEHGDVGFEISAQDLSDLNKLLGEEEPPDLDAILGEGQGPANTPTSTLTESVSLSRLSSSVLALDAIAEQKNRASLESDKDTLDKMKDAAQSLAARAKAFFKIKPAEGVKKVAEAGMSAISGGDSVAKHISSALIETGSAVSVALPGIGAALGIAEVALLSRKIEVLDNRLTNLQYILEKDIPNISINTADPHAVADLKKLEDAAKYAISQLSSRRMMLSILFAGTITKTTGTAVVMLSGATGVGAALGAGIGIAGSTTKQIPLLKRVARYAYKKATDTLGVERSIHAEALIGSARHWHPHIASCADNMLIQLGATKNLRAAGLSAHHESLDADLINEAQHKQVKTIVERKLRSFP